ncbi:hypothetical protein ACU4GD_21470 [Cupriavidus basilensis]
MTHQEALKRMLENRHFAGGAGGGALRSVEPRHRSGAVLVKISGATLPRVRLTDDKLRRCTASTARTSFASPTAATSHGCIRWS